MYWKTHLFYCSTVTLTLVPERLLPYKALSFDFLPNIEQKRKKLAVMTQ